MGQYWKPVNLTKREFFDPHSIGSGAKLEELEHSKFVGAALVHLLSGDWCGDKIAIVGDTNSSRVEIADGEFMDSSHVYEFCLGHGKSCPEWLNQERLYKDITPEVAAWLEEEFEGLFDGPWGGYRKFVPIVVPVQK